MTLQSIIHAEHSDLFDVLLYISFALKPISRAERVKVARDKILASLDIRQKEFLDFVLSKYIESGVCELDDHKLPDLLRLKYKAIDDANKILGSSAEIRQIFCEFQKYLYEKPA